MIVETEEYKGRKFKCNLCGYVVSSNAMSDFDVDDFEHCPCCGSETRLTEYEAFCSYLQYTSDYFGSMASWSNQDRLQEIIYAIEKEILRLREKYDYLKR